MMVTTSASSAGRGDENPPPYRGSGHSDNTSKESTGANAASSSGSTASPPREPPDIPRCNLLNISRPKEGIKGEYVVDPSVAVPDAMLAPLQADGARPNLRLASNKTVDADVWVLAGAPSSDPIRLIFIAREAALKVRIHDMGTSRCMIEAGSGRNVSLTIPRDFVGIVTTSTTRGPAAMPGQFATLSEVDGEGKYFMGDLALIGTNVWHGTAIDIAAPMGKIRVTLAGDAAPDECVVS